MFELDNVSCASLNLLLQRSCGIDDFGAHAGLSPTGVR